MKALQEAEDNTCLFTQPLLALFSSSRTALLASPLFTGMWCTSLLAPKPTASAHEIAVLSVGRLFGEWTKVWCESLLLGHGKLRGYQSTV